MPRNELRFGTTRRTSTSNKWNSRRLPQRFFDSRNANQKTEVWENISTNWESFE